MRRHIFALIILLALLIAVVQFPQPAQANNITVDGNCTLIDAIIAANTDAPSGNCPAGSGADTIVLDVDANLTAPYLGSTDIGGGQAGLPDITTDITIQAGTHSIINGNSTNFRILYVSDTGKLTLDSVEVSGGRLAPVSGSAYGAGIYSNGSLGINNTLIHDNTLDSATGTQYGAGIYGLSGLPGAFSVLNSTISHNEITNSSGYGGGAYFEGEAVLLSGVVFSHNSIASGWGGGAYFTGEDISLNDVIFSDNFVTSGWGGGLACDECIVEMNNGDFVNNTAAVGGGAILIFSDLTVYNTIFEGNTATSTTFGGTGGGLFLEDVWIHDFDFVEFKNNKAENGGGIGGGGIAIPQQSVWSGFVATDNIASVKGGAVYLEWIQLYDITFEDTILQRNQAGSGGALYVDESPPLTFLNATISDNYATDIGGFYAGIGVEAFTFVDSNILGLTQLKAKS